MNHLADADGVVCEALCEEEDSVRGSWVVFSQLEGQQVGGHVLKLPGPETQTEKSSCKKSLTKLLSLCDNINNATDCWYLKLLLNTEYNIFDLIFLYLSHSG